jgi:hypothetical protein
MGSLEQVFPYRRNPVTNLLIRIERCDHNWGVDPTENGDSVHIAWCVREAVRLGCDQLPLNVVPLVSYSRGLP